MEGYFSPLIYVAVLIVAAQLLFMLVNGQKTYIEPRYPVARASTRNTKFLFPPVTSKGLGSEGIRMGNDILNKGSFILGVWYWYSRKIITSINMLVVGAIGSGKSALVKSYLLRSMSFGIVPWVISPKPEEYDRFAEYAGVTPVRLTIGGNLRVNIFDPSLPYKDQLGLLRTVLETLLARTLEPIEGSIAAEALSQARSPLEERRFGRTRLTGEMLVGDVVEALYEPDEDVLTKLRFYKAVDGESEEQRAVRLNQARESHLEHARDMVHTLERLLPGGDLEGMFDQPTSAEIDLDARAVVIDVSGVGKDALPLVMLVVAAWLQGQWNNKADRKRRIVVLDEAWRALQFAPILSWVSASMKLSRTLGVQYVLVLHRLSDLEAVGDQGSAQHSLAFGLLEDTVIRVVYRQEEGQTRLLKEMLGLGQRQLQLVRDAEQGEGLWIIGRRSFYVHNELTDDELDVTYTDEGMDVDANAPSARSATANVA